mmetsp:Transcript_19846/g.63159  ORF Transcript_19846/g.63159 Transcript_19846/m.63159 type:complete len:428 (-) Transcript_19846:237-1520(-)
MTDAPPRPPLCIYEGRTPSLQWVEELRARLESSSWDDPTKLKELVPLDTLMGLVHDSTKLLEQTDAAVVDIAAPLGSEVVVVGDTHGQLHDVLRLLELSGQPSASSLFVFNGDFVDRGAWGLEVVLLLIAHQLAQPQYVTLLRGNHETRFCTMVYGFQAEVVAKYGAAGTKVYSRLLKLFSLLPLAAVVGAQGSHGNTIVLHGGLFRAPELKPKPDHAPRAKKGGKKKGTSQSRMSPPALAIETEVGLRVGMLADLRKAAKGGLDPNGLGKSVLATDVLWSDPDPCLHQVQENTERGVGLVFGEGALEDFLRGSDLRLVVRSHEGPDARDKREGLPGMERGFSEDLKCESGRLVTVFSAPDYPQFVAEGENRVHNQGAFIRLRGPDFTDPQPVCFDAAPRPKASAYYDVSNTGDTDDEFADELSKAN